MTESDFLKQFVPEEESSGCYSVMVNGVTAYTLIRQEFRHQMALHYGVESMNLTGTRSKASFGHLIGSSFSSLWQLFKLRIKNKKYPVVILSFPRIEKIDGIYIDKFTDPLIEISDLNIPFLILEPGRMGVHFKPRVHSESMLNTDFIRVFSALASVLCYRSFKKKYARELGLLMDSLRALSNGQAQESILKSLLLQLTEINIYKRLYCRLGTKYVLGPTRPTEQFVSAHLMGAKVFELQHGITYGDSILYSGFRDPLLVPDCFLAFGDNAPANVYGIDEQRIVNIGWALQAYFDRVHPTGQRHGGSVLVISDPEISNILVRVVSRLATDNPTISFVIRPHPLENLSDESLNKISQHKNIVVQDNHINITETLMTFDMVVGENSTVLYEALSANKKVGKLFYPGLRPQFLVADDRDSFWEISNQNDFERFIKGRITDKKSKSIYSPFDKERFETLFY